MGNKDLAYELVTEKMVQMIEAGTVPWQQPWNDGTAPRSIRGHKYRGVNVFLLLIAQVESEFSSPFWITYNQAEKMGGQVRKGEKSTRVVMWKMLERRDEKDPDKVTRIPMIRYYNVFNLDQVDGVEPPELKESERFEHTPIEAAEAIAAGYQDPPKVREVGEYGRAHYDPGADVITLPGRDQFPTPEQFYGTLFHEMGHSTGHPDRLNRFTGVDTFGSHTYGREELVAEMTAAFVTAEAGITVTHENSAAYLDSWRRTIQEDVKAVVVAAGKAQRAADMILGRTFDDDEG